MDGLMTFTFPPIEAVQFEGQAQLADLEEFTGGRCDMAHDLIIILPNGDELRAQPTMPHRAGDWVCKRTDRPTFQGGLFILDDVTFRAMTT